MVSPSHAEQVTAPENVKPLDDRDWFGAGSGWAEYQEILSDNFAEQLQGMDSEIYPSAEAMLPLAQGLLSEGDTSRSGATSLLAKQCRQKER